MKTAARVLAVIVGLGGVLGLVQILASLLTMHRTGALSMLLADSPERYVLLGQWAVAATINICSIVLAPLVFFVTEER